MPIILTYQKKSFAFSKDTKLDENRDYVKGLATLAWAQGIYGDLFS
jgi:hypothetical protein